MEYKSETDLPQNQSRCATLVRTVEEGASDQFEYYKRAEAESNLVWYLATKGQLRLYSMCDFLP